MNDMEEKGKKPEIRFTGFTDTWEQRKLEDVAEFLDEKRKPLKAGTRVSGQYPYYGASGIIDYVKDYLFDEELILLSEDGANIVDRNYRVCFLASGKYWVNNHAHILRSRENYVNGFLCESLERLDYKKYNTGTAQPKLNQEVCRHINIMIPKKLEQSKIWMFLMNLDNLIALHQRKYDKLIIVKKSMLEKMFPKGGTNVPEIRFAGFTDAWEQREMYKVAGFSKGQGYSKNDLIDVGTQIILYGRLYTNYQAVISEVDTFALEKNGSIYSIGNEVIVPASGETAEDIARASAIVKPGILLGGDLNIIYPNDNINSIFLALAITNGKQKRELSKRAKGKSIVHLHNSDLKEIEISYPDKVEQSKIGTFFCILDNLITLHQRELEKLKNIKKSMLEKMFV